MVIDGRGDLVAKTAEFLPQYARDDAGAFNAMLVRRLPDHGHVVVWQVGVESVKSAKALHAWMWSNPGDWSYWGRIAQRLGPDALTPMILDAAESHAKAVQKATEERRKEAREQARLARQITLFSYDPKKKQPYLGLERGSESRPFFRMTFTERWERDRVVDWLRHQKPQFGEMEQIFTELGALELERHILAGMRETERDVKVRGLSAGGRRPLRFWRGE
jgi:hypothetical protein